MCLYLCVPGCGYGIVTPDMFHHPINGCVTVQDNRLVIAGGNGHHDNLPTIYIPLPTATQNVAEMRSISCQTEEKEKKEEEEKEKKTGSKKLERSLSLRESKKNKKMDNVSQFSRSQSMRFSEDRGKNVVKDINLKTSDAHQDKDKGGYLGELLLSSECLIVDIN